MKKTFFLLVIIAFNLQFSQAQSEYKFPFQNPALSVEERAADIVSRLGLKDKVRQMLNKAPAIDSLGISAYDWWNECLHGVARTEYKVTVYPQAIGMAAGWDADAMRLMGDYTATEGRAIYNTSSAKGDFSIYHGLTYWTPNINIFRDPRWGRGQETYGEDPYLTSALAASFVNGLQGGDPKYLKAAGCAKHFAVHSGPEALRHNFDISVSNYDLWDTYLPAFKRLAETGVAGFMCAYNAFDGQPCCGSDKLMLDILRIDWNYKGYVTSDCGAIDDFYKRHRTHPNSAAAAADAVFHGTDVDCGNEAYFGLVRAVRDGLITEDAIDISLRRLFATRLRLGLLDPKEIVPFSNIDSTYLELPEHKELALKMARQSIVLLKNEKNLLPIDRKKVKKIAVLGPNCDNEWVQLGNYNGFPTENVTVLEGIRREAGPGIKIYSDTVIGYAGATPASFASTIENVKDADLIVFVGGISPRLEGEEMRVNVDGFRGGDRTTIALPKIQTDLMKTLKSTGKPVVFVMMTGSAIAVEWESQNIPAIMNAWYGGQSTGTAVADVIFGKYNPSGRLPVTFYAKDSDLPPFEDYNMENRTYRYFTGKALYPFGYGLSFSNFAYNWTKIPSASISDKETIECAFKVTNKGKFSGDEVAQIYIKYPDGKKLPLKELRTFKRVGLDKGASSEVNVSIPASDLSKWDNETGKMAVPKGIYTIFAGGNSENEAISAQFEIK
ncbi:MAG: glycoside hydrolase family 3 C-terminal domain-containing protein [Dysgonamonadaceae bacterium]|nr:glycoside hydrolase family 3 C-terminal domain-containing protein [Dysgonamonadaceae bacterium]